MSIVVPHVAGLVPHEQSQLERNGVTAAARALLECLILSPDAARRELLAHAAKAGGWAIVVCGDAETARQQARRIAVKLAFVDLERAGPAEAQRLREMSAELIRLCNPLMVVCGPEGDAQMEIWAREMGVWLYLPGMAGVEPMARLCDEARTIVERARVLTGANGNGNGHSNGNGHGHGK